MRPSARIEATRQLNATPGTLAGGGGARDRAARRSVFSVKDNIAVAGWPLSLGVHVKPPPETFTATAVARLRAAMSSSAVRKPATVSA